MDLDYLLKVEYFPNYSKKELLEIVKDWIDPDEATIYINENYDTWKAGSPNKKSVYNEPTFIGSKKRLTKVKKPKSLRGSNITPPKKKRK